MGKVGFQDFWVAGSRFYFQRDPINGATQPFVDIGTIEAANPSFSPQLVQLDDPDGGVKNKVDELISKIEETYEVTVKNMNLENLSLLFLSTAPEAFTQTAVQKNVAHDGFVGRLIKIQDSDDTWLYGLSAVYGAYGAGTSTIAVNSIASNVITVTGDVASAVNSSGFVIINSDITASAEAGTYAAAAVFGGVNTTITITGGTLTNQAGAAGTIRYGSEIYETDVDWEVVSLDRGLIRMIDGGAFSADGTVNVSFKTAAITGNRLIKPQSLKGTVRGKMSLIYGRGTNTDQTVREATVTISPSSTNITADDYSSMVLTVSVVSDLTAEDDVAGRMFQFKGTLPDKS